MATLNEIVSTVINGGVVIIPTEFAYCYAADPFSKSAVKALKELNNSQDVKQEITILVGDLDDMPNLLESIEPTEEQKAIEHWPSEKTILFSHPSKWLSKDLYYQGKDLVLRLPAENFVLEILHAIGQPLATIAVCEKSNLVRNSLSLKNSEHPYLKVQQSLSGKLPEVI
ncbi:MAG: hypothetical protein GY793_05425 [Proteobacteria bacterium]|nr:hypothetical protein [Pseudomonadota bacterium]